MRKNTETIMNTKRLFGPLLFGPLRACASARLVPFLRCSGAGVLRAVWSYRARLRVEGAHCAKNRTRTAGAGWAGLARAPKSGTSTTSSSVMHEE